MRRGRIAWWTRRAVFGLLAFVALLAAAGAAYQILATEIDERRYPPPGEMVDVGGHKLHINCTGEGSPTVLLESGLGDNSFIWSWVQPELAKDTRVCSYDRAGLGFSEPSGTPRDSRQITGELHRLLENAGIKGPYVLVAHSLGGFHARVFADRYPNEVAGMVLVDSSSEDQPISGAEVSPDILCRVLPLLGVTRLSGNESPELPARVRAEAEAASNRTQYCTTTAREGAAMAKSAAQVREAGSLGDLPLIVLSHGAPPELEGLPPEEAQQMKAFEEIWPALQEDLVRLSSDGEQIVAEKSGHYVQIDQPELVIEATRQVVEEARVGQEATR